MRIASVEFHQYTQRNTWLTESLTLSASVISTLFSPLCRSSIASAVSPTLFCASSIREPRIAISRSSRSIARSKVVSP